LANEKLISDNMHLKRRQFLTLGSLAMGTGLLGACSNPQPSNSTSAEKLDKIKLGLGWKAEAEYGGFYQAAATGIYREHGLDVTIDATPPQTNMTQLLMGGVVDFMVGNAVDTLKSIQQGIPKVTLASMFQKEIQILLAHPGVGNDSLLQLKGKPAFISASANTTYWPVLKSKYGLTDDQIRPYNYNISPFLADKNSVQQGILTAEPYLIEKKGGFKPVILALSDSGYNPYTFTLDTTQKLFEARPELVQRFVDASIKGWYSYIKDPTLGNAAIKQANPEMTDDLIAYSLAKLNEYGIIASGDAAKLGIGAMTDARWEGLFKDLSSVGVLDSKVDYKKAYSLKFTNRGADYYTRTNHS
jgi:NitT/TauT family transport system substrate-binding protein